MSSTDEIDFMLLAELLDNFGAESVWHSSFVCAVRFDVFVRIRPEQVAEKSMIGDLLRPLQFGNLLKCSQLWTEPAVHAEDATFDQRCDRHLVEAFTELLPEWDSVAPTALFEETISSVDCGDFVVASKQIEVLWEFDLHGKK
jgi:hypothetical protein